jgi:lysophospholipase L1-like esterase
MVRNRTWWFPIVASHTWTETWSHRLAGKAKHAVFGLLTALLILIVVEAGGYSLFYLVHGELPHAYGARTFKVMRLTVTDHPYLPYFRTSGLGQIRLNSLGDRGPEPDVPKRRLRILCFGGSTTFDQEHGWDETWPGQLQRMLGADSVEVLNAAHNGDTTAETLVKLAMIHGDLQPDLVLVYHGHNDLEASYAHGFRSDYAHRRRDVSPTPYPVFDRLPRWLDYSSGFVALRSYLVGYRGSMWNLYTRPGKGLDLVHGPFGLPTFERNLRSIDAMARLAGARVVLGTFQYYRPWAEVNQGPEWAAAWERGIDAQNDIIRDLARREENIRVADVARAFVPTPDHMLDLCHLKPPGNREIAAAYAAVVRELLHDPAPGEAGAVPGS